MKYLGKQTKKHLFKYVVLLLSIIVFLIFYNNPYNETFDNNEEREGIYLSAISQIREDVTNKLKELRVFIHEYHNNVLHGDVKPNDA